MAKPMTTIYKHRNKYRIQATINGKRVSIGVATTKSEANRLAKEYDKRPTINPQMTLEQLYTIFIDRHSKEITSSTLDNYKQGYKALEPLTHTKVRVIRTTDLQSCIDTLSDTCSYSKISKVKTLLNMLYKFAMANDIIDRNYAEYIKLPKHTKKKPDVFTQAEIKILLDNADGDMIVQSILILLTTAFRINAFLSLKTDDYKNGIIYGGNKTEAGKGRPHPVHRNIQQYVDNFININGNRLICDEQGQGYSYGRYTRRYYAVLKKLGIRKLTPHKCKHTILTMLNRAGANDVALKNIGGHSSVKTSKDIYSHTDEDMLVDTINLVNLPLN